MEVLLYQLEQGKDEMWIAEQCRQSNQPLPKKIENAPQLGVGLELYWDAYTELSGSRSASFSGAAPIPWPTVAEYAMLYEFDEEQRERLFYFVRTMDAAFIRWFEKKHGHK